MLGRTMVNGTSRLLLVAVVATLGACGGRSERTSAHGVGTAGAGVAGGGGTATDGSGGTVMNGTGGTVMNGTGGTATNGTGGTATNGTGGTVMNGTGGTVTDGTGGVATATGGAGGSSAAGGSSGTTAAGGTSGSGTGEAGAAPTETSAPFGDIDQPWMGLPPPGGNSPSFYWSRGLGNWFVTSLGSKEKDAPVDDIMPPRGDRTKSLHVSGADYGEELDLFAQLNHPLNRPVDLRGFSSISFWARLSGDSSTIILVMNDGSFFLPSKNDFSTLPSGAFVATDAWQEFVFDIEPARVSSVVSIDFVVQGGGDAVDFWLDELTLVCRGACQ